MISIAMRNTRLNSVRTRQTQVESQLSEYMNTHVPENILTTRIRHNQQVDENQVDENQVDENQVNEVAQERTNGVVNFTTLNNVLLTHTLLSMMQQNRTNRRRSRYAIQRGSDIEGNVD